LIRQGACSFHSSSTRHANASVREMYRKSSGSRSSGTGYVLLIIPAATFCLGTWQVRRRRWKLDLIEGLKERTTAAPVPLLEHLNELESMEYRRVVVKGKFDHTQEISIGPRGPLVPDTGGSLIGGGGKLSAGAHIITRFQPTDMKGQSIMVNRGWVPKDKIRPETRVKGQVEEEVELVGILRNTEKRPPFMSKNNPELGMWYHRDLDAMSQVLHTQPILIDAVKESSWDGGPVGGQTRVTLRNEHFSYILTWYSLSAFTSLMWYKMIWKK